MSNLGIIIEREFLERVKKKSFIITTILMPVLMLALMAYLVMENKPFLIAAHPLFLLLPCALLTPRGKPLNVVCPTDER